VAQMRLVEAVAQALQLPRHRRRAFDVGEDEGDVSGGGILAFRHREISTYLTTPPRSRGSARRTGRRDGVLAPAWVWTPIPVIFHHKSIRTASRNDGRPSALGAPRPARGWRRPPSVWPRFFSKSCRAGCAGRARGRLQETQMSPTTGPTCLAVGRDGPWS